jgi:hypothetical protein
MKFRDNERRLKNLEEEIEARKQALNKRQQEINEKYSI